MSCLYLLINNIFCLVSDIIQSAKGEVGILFFDELRKNKKDEVTAFISMQNYDNCLFISLFFAVFVQYAKK